MLAEGRQQSGERRLVLESGQELLSLGRAEKGCPRGQEETPVERMLSILPTDAALSGFWNSLSPPELGCYQLQQGWWAGRVRISCPYSWSPRLSALSASSCPLQGELDNSNPTLESLLQHCPSMVCKPAVWNSASDWKPQLPQWIPLFHAQRGVRQRCPGKKGPLRPAVCQVPVWAPGTQSERSPCLPGAHSQARETRLSQPFQRFWRKQSPLPGGPQPPSTRHSIGRGHHLPLPPGRGSRPLIYLPSPRPRTEHCNASS